jgi:VCBS repeat-containing protein
MWDASTYTFTPAADYNGSVAFTLTTSVGDLPGIIVVSAVNDDPVITSGSSTDTSLSTAEDTAVNGTITATDVDGDTLTYTYSTPTSGAITNTDGTYTYTPTANANGSDSFTITVSDGTTTVQQAVTVAITAVDDSPVMESTSTLAVTEDEAAAGTITATEVDGQTLTYTYSTPSKGAITNTDGSNTYTPTANANGSDSFTVTVSDGTSTDVVQTVAVSIAAVDDAAVVSATTTSSGNVYSVAFALDHTAISNADLAGVTEFALTFSGSGTATSSNGLVEQGGLSTYYAAWTSITDTRGELDALDTVVETGSFGSNIFTTSETWTEGYVTTIPVTSEATTWRYIVESTSTDIDITSYLSTSGSLGTLVFTLEDDVTEFDITVTGTVSGLASDFETAQSETLDSFVIEIV